MNNGITNDEAGYFENKYKHSKIFSKKTTMKESIDYDPEVIFKIELNQFRFKWKQKWENDKDHESYDKEFDLEIINLLKKHSYAVEASQAWIDCKKQQPDIGDEYNVVWDLDDDEPPVVTTMEWNNITKMWSDVIGESKKNRNEEVLFWQPLPSPPKPITP